MSGLMSAKCSQLTPNRAASCFWSGRMVLLPDADAPLTFAVALAARSIQEKRRKIFSHCEAAVIIAYQSLRDRGYELAIVRQPAMNRKDRFGGRDQRLVAGSFESVLGRLDPLTPAVDTNNISVFGTRDFMRRHPVARW